MSNKLDSIIDELSWRGLVKQYTNEDKIKVGQLEHTGVYCGFDPTADSLHVGHLIPITLLKRFNDYGFKPIALIGGGTGMIGDPSFKSQERVLQTNEQVKAHAQAIEAQLKGIIPNVIFANNYEWLSSLSLLDFLRDIGKEFSLGYLLGKEAIKSRIETGLSVTEFMYTMLQAYDFLKLYEDHDCHLQIGGSDQWGNITSGIDLIASKLGREESKAAGLTINLLTKKDGMKFGKTESGAIWLDANKTNVYQFYQFWFNQDDDDALLMIKYFTFLTKVEINQLEEESRFQPKERLIQKKLALEVTKFVHGENGLAMALKITDIFFNGNLNSLNNEEIMIIFNSVPNGTIKVNDSLIDVVVASKAATSKREAREFIIAGAISINEAVLSDENLKIDQRFSLDHEHIIVKRGKKKFFGAEFK